MTSGSMTREKIFQQLYGSGWVLLLWLLLSAVMLVDVRMDPRMEVGSVSTRNIRAPERVTYISEILTEREREAARNAVEAIYHPPDRSQAVHQTGTAVAISNFLEAVRNDPYADEPTRIDYITAVQPVRFDTAAAERILALSDEAWNEVVAEAQRLVDTQMRGEIRESQLQQVLSSLPNQIDVSLSEDQTQIVRILASGLITPNTFQDHERTEQEREEARASVKPVERTYEAGQIIIREGEIVTPERLEALQALGLQQPARSAGAMVGTSIFLLLLVLALVFYIVRLHPNHWQNPRAMAMITALLVLMALGARIIMPDHSLLTYLFPTATAAMLLGVLLGVDVAIIVTLVLSLIVGYLTRSIEMITYTFISGMMAALILWRVERLGVFVWTGVLVGLTNVGIVLVFALENGTYAWFNTALVSSMALLNGATSASLALAGFYVLSNFLGITTFLQLMELARPTHPLFREVLLKAPGTYAHTIIVSNLAERAAEAIGADMLLVRVGAYYHDVGKTINPHYFVENQDDGVNLHEALDDPYESAAIIVGHVTEGLKLAKKHKLPRPIIDFIAQHHGTTQVVWFYHKACEEEGKEQIDPSAFRYPGPKPQTREAAIMMLADSVEATARAMKPAGTEEIDELIRKIIVAKLGEGQLDESNLNLKDLDVIRRAFVDVLKSVYHPRIVYPEQPGEETTHPTLPAVHSSGEEAEQTHHGEGEQHSDRGRSTVGTAG